MEIERVQTVGSRITHDSVSQHCQAVGDMWPAPKGIALCASSTCCNCRSVQAVVYHRLNLLLAFPSSPFFGASAGIPSLADCPVPGLGAAGDGDAAKIPITFPRDMGKAESPLGSCRYLALAQSTRVCQNQGCLKPSFCLSFLPPNINPYQSMGLDLRVFFQANDA